MQQTITTLLQTSIASITEAIRLAEQNSLTDEQWFLDLETLIGYLACQDHHENVKC